MKTVYAVCVFGAAILAFATCHPAGAGPVQLTLRPYGNTDLRTVEVTVNGHEIPFIFDTGAGITVLTPEEARYAGCTPFGQVTGFRADGARVTSSRCGPVALEIGRSTASRNLTSISLDSALCP